MLLIAFLAARRTASWKNVSPWVVLSYPILAVGTWFQVTHFGLRAVPPIWARSGLYLFALLISWMIRPSRPKARARG
jgi:hypothetical protein